MGVLLKILLFIVVIGAMYFSIKTLVDSIISLSLYYDRGFKTVANRKITLVIFKILLSLIGGILSLFCLIGYMVAYMQILFKFILN